MPHDEGSEPFPFARNGYVKTKEGAVGTTSLMSSRKRVGYRRGCFSVQEGLLFCESVLVD